ncbi:MAG: hypothetical protein HZA90_05170 [Verrucomicrobia bacterium]|nr:hypothetical protein [Verrucomicrobiota bacterium]
MAGPVLETEVHTFKSVHFQSPSHSLSPSGFARRPSPFLGRLHSVLGGFESGHAKARLVAELEEAAVEENCLLWLRRVATVLSKRVEIRRGPFRRQLQIA